MKALITGANRGIGLAFCTQLLQRGDEVIAVCRERSQGLDELGNKSSSLLRIIEDVDVTNDQDVDKLVEALGGDKIDLLINNAGIMASVTLENLDIASIYKQFEINAVAPLRVTHALLGHLSDHAKVGIVTSRMGSIDDNDSGGSYGYRMSKAAANMAGRSLSVDLKDRGISVAMLHPGWVRTDMTGGNGLIDAPESAQGLIAIMDRLDVDQTGLFWHTNGEILVW
ncbi:MAG: SDR family oxidoreductase [bacterium]|nr:SDR family oxidoreductase [bacterium]